MPEYLALRCGEIYVKRYTAINIGSNSSKVLVADCDELNDGLHLKKVFTDVVVTGIGKSVHETGRLTKEGIDSTVEAVAGFTDRAEQLKSDIIWLTATEAARTAENSDELKSEISNRTGFDLDIIPYTKESELAFSGVLSTGMMNGISPKEVMVVDSGGASTELIKSNGDTFEAKDMAVVSLKVGAATLTQELIAHDPPTREEAMKVCQHVNYLLDYASADLAGEDLKKIYGIGGAATTMAALKLGISDFDEESVNGTVMTLDECRELFDKVISLSLEERKYMKGIVNPARALTIPAGIAIFYQCMKVMGVNEVVVSTSGILEGMIIDMAKWKCV